MLNILANGSAKYSITDFMDLIENLSMSISLLFDKLTTTVWIALLVQGAMKNETEFGFGMSVIEVLEFPGVIF